MQNPYLELLDMLGPNNSLPFNFYIAEVVNSNPLNITFEGITLDSEDFLVNSNVLTLNNAEITTSNDTIVTHNLKDVINVGDKVLMLFTGSKYVLLCKVVSV
nr:MAG TPA: Protein of unknown function (DUF2577) [Caudoviricetes sp.]